MGKLDNNKRDGLVGHERGQGKDDWLTPPGIIEALGPFDLDPCASIDQPWATARLQYTKEDDGLSKSWHGFVWCNPPYGRETKKWIQRMVEHHNGIALIFARTETSTFFPFIWEYAESLFFIKGRLKFCFSNGKPSKNSAGGPSMLVGFGEEALQRLQHCSLEGKFVRLKEIT